MTTPLPPVSDLVQSGISKGVFRGALTQLRAFLAERLGTTGNQSDALKALGTVLHSRVDKVGAYTVTNTDRGAVMSCSGTWTLSVSDAAALGDGFTFAVLNVGTGTITVDPYLTQTIDGSQSKSVGAGKLLICYCDGTRFTSVGGIDSAAVTSALGYTPANLANAYTDHNHSGQYSPMTAITGAAATTVTVAGGGDAWGLRFTQANGNTFTVQTGAVPQGGGGSGGSSCVHMHSLIAMFDEPDRFACDVRPGDKVWTPDGPDEVIGVKVVPLSKRTMCEVNGSLVITPDHLIPSGTGWLVRDREQYAKYTFGKRSPVKTKNGLRHVVSGTIEPDQVGCLQLGSVILRDSGLVEVTSIRDVDFALPEMSVVSFALAGGVYYADGYAVAALGIE